MNRELLVKLIQKNIDELIMLTEGFLEMTSYPPAIISLAKHKTDDIWSYIHQLGELEIDAQPVETMDEIVDEDIAMDENLDERIDEAVEETIDEYIVEDTPEIIEVVEEVVEVAVETAEEETEEAIEEEDLTEDFIEDVIEDAIEDEQFEDAINEDIAWLEEEREQPEVAPKTITLAEKISTGSATRNDALTNGEKADLNASIANQKITDIRQAISIGDRFRFQRELFKNNGEDMNKTLSYIDKLPSIEEIESFLQSKYNWDQESPNVVDFYNIVKRKF